jgi:serine protease AprX
LKGGIMKKFFICFQFFVMLTLALGLLGPAAVKAVRAEQDDLPVHPGLLQVIQEHPDDLYRVVVQKASKEKNPEKQVEDGGGKVKKQLELITSFAAEMTGKEVLKLAKHKEVRWISIDAPMVSTSVESPVVMDSFTTTSYSGNNGSWAWASSWLENGESTSPSAGLMQVSSSLSCAGGSGYCLRVDPYKNAGDFVYRQVNLSGALAVTLSLYRNNQLNINGGNSEEVKLEVSADGGSTWTTLRTYSHGENTGAATDSFDLTSYASGNTLLRFLITRWQTGSRYLYIDDIRIEYLVESRYATTTGATQLRTEFPGLTGAGVTVAVVDSGMKDHTDLQARGGGSRVIANQWFGNLLDPFDAYGHGSHVAGILAGNGAASLGSRAGMAPGANLINLRVSDQYGMSYTSDVVAALEWIYNNRAAYNIQVVNLSLNSTVPESYHTSPLDAAVEILWFNGIVVVVAAGNNGSDLGPSTLYPPANDPFVITVGAAEDQSTVSRFDDSVAVYSAYGTTENGFSKPDLVAPGRNVVSLLASTGATAYTMYPLHRVNDLYFRMNGTSMAAPMVSGAAALLLQDEPKLTPDQVKFRLKATTSQAWEGYNSAKAGAGYLDAYAAVLGTTSESANKGIPASLMLATGTDPITWGTVGWNSVGWNTVGWNTVGWNTVGWNTVGWNTSTWDSADVSAALLQIKDLSSTISLLWNQ